MILLGNHTYAEFVMIFLGNDVATKYIQNCRHIDPTEKPLNKNSVLRCIDNSFYWSSTPDGHEYWREKDKQMSCNLNDLPNL
jgi:hypothetical protein